MVSRRDFLGRFSLAAASCGVAPAALAEMLDDMPPPELMSHRTREGIRHGLEYLARRQNDEGTFGRAGYRRNVAVVGLVGTAFMASGSTPGRGPFGENVNRCVGYLLSHCQPSGFINAPGTSSHGPMYGHGFATLFLAEVYGMTRDSQVREKLAAAVKLILSTQNAEGGWRYQPERREADISVTICQVMALRAARNAGIYVPNGVIDRCLDYVKRSQNPDGGFNYTLDVEQSAFPRSAAGVVALYSAGVYDGPEIDRGLEYLKRNVPHGSASREPHYYYGHYYAVQAMWHAGGDHWTRWYPAIRDTLLDLQAGDGSWDDAICAEYGTAMACIILQMPNNYLPIFQR